MAEGKWRGFVWPHVPARLGIGLGSRLGVGWDQGLEQGQKHGCRRKGWNRADLMAWNIAEGLECVWGNNLE